MISALADDARRVGGARARRRPRVDALKVVEAWEAAPPGRVKRPWLIESSCAA